MQAAMYDGLCAICSVAHIKVGDPIVQHGRGWAEAECAAAFARLGDADQRVRVEMRNRGIAFGIAPDGSDLRTTGTRTEFYSIAQRLGLLTSAQRSDLSRTQALIWENSLTD